MNTLRNSAEKIPPFFMAPLFLMLKETERLGCLKWNSLGDERQRQGSEMYLLRTAWERAGPLPGSGSGIRCVPWEDMCKDLLRWNVFRSTGPVGHPVDAFLQSINFFLSFCNFFFWLWRRITTLKKKKGSPIVPTTKDKSRQKIHEISTVVHHQFLCKKQASFLKTLTQWFEIKAFNILKRTWVGLTVVLSKHRMWTWKKCTSGFNAH